LDPETRPLLPTGRPVRRFVLVVGVISAVCIGVWWMAVFAPRLSVVATNTTPDDGGRDATLTFVLRNEGPLPFDLVGESADYPGIELAAVRVGGHDLDTGALRVEGTVRVEAEVRVDCGRLRGDNPDPAFYSTEEQLRVTVRAPAVVERTRTVRTFSAVNSLTSRTCS